MLQSQELRKDKYRDMLYTAINNYNTGSSFSYLVFNINKGEYKILSVVSSNFKTKEILDSLHSKVKGFKLEVKDNVNDANFALPIIQIGDNEPKNELNWNNNTLTGMASFGRGFILPHNTIMLKPIVSFNSPVIIN